MAQSPAPAHIAFILDGNRRWAKEHGLPKLEGHRRGYELLKKVSLAAFDRGVKYVSGYIFSTENWNREVEEVNYLMDLALKMFERDMNEMHEKNVRIRVIGSKERISPKIAKAIVKAEEQSKDNTGGTICVCFNYGGRDEILAATKSIVDEGVSFDQITDDIFRSHMYTHDVPDPDIIVRTGGEQRLSNFLLWEAAYSELMFLPEFWPDFSVAGLEGVIDEYNRRKRNFGK